MKHLITTTHFIFYVLIVRPTIQRQETIIPDKKTTNTIISLKMCSTCFPERDEVTILIGNWSKIDDVPTELNLVSIVGLNDTEKLEDYSSKRKYYTIDPTSKLYKPQPAKKMIILEIEAASLALALHKLKDTIWWNVYGYYFIENTMSSNSCEDAYTIFKILWKFDIVSAVFTCNHDERVDSYTFNPYANRATKIWKEDRIYTGKNLHPFVVYKLKSYFFKETDCQDVFYDKTIVLDGFPVGIMGRDLIDSPYDPKEKSPYKIRGIIGKMFEILLRKLNVTINLTIVTTNFSSYFDENGEPHGSFKYFQDGGFDLLLKYYENSGNCWRNKIYANMQSNLCYVSKKKFMSLRELIQTVVSAPFILTTITILCLLPTIFAYFVNRSVLEIWLDSLRLSTGSKSIYQPKVKTERITFLMLTIVIMVVSFGFQNKLISIITVPSYRPLINTIEDIVKYNYTIYTHPRMIQEFADSSFKQYYKVIGGLDSCLTFMETVKNVVCMKSCYITRYKITENTFTHVAVDDTHNIFYVHFLRDDFSLHGRFALVYYRLIESGFDLYVKRSEVTSNASRRNDVFYKPSTLSVDQLNFIFVFLAWGYAFGTAVFIVELLLQFVFPMITRNRQNIFSK